MQYIINDLSTSTPKESDINNINELKHTKFKEWEETDKIYCNELEDKVFIERAFYRSLIIINFKENLKNLDGIIITENEINKSRKRIKKLKNILQKSLGSINELQNENLDDHYKAIITKNQKNLTNLLSTIDKDLNSSNDINRSKTFNKSIYININININ